MFSNTQLKRSRRACWRKVPHHTLVDAQVEAARLNAINGDQMVIAYHCAACLMYHCGRQRKTRNMT